MHEWKSTKNRKSKIAEVRYQKFQQVNNDKKKKTQASINNLKGNISNKEYTVSEISYIIASADPKSRHLVPASTKASAPGLCVTFPSATPTYQAATIAVQKILKRKCD